MLLYLKAQADALFTELGMNLTTAFNIFVRQSLREGGIPFEVRLEQPNKETVAAMLEAERIAKDPSVKGYNDLDELFADLKDDLQINSLPPYGKTCTAVLQSYFIYTRNNCCFNISATGDFSKSSMRFSLACFLLKPFSPKSSLSNIVHSISGSSQTSFSA